MGGGAFDNRFVYVNIVCFDLGCFCHEYDPTINNNNNVNNVELTTLFSPSLPTHQGARPGVVASHCHRWRVADGQFCHWKVYVYKLQICLSR